MKSQTRLVLSSFAIAAIATVVVAGVASIPHCSSIGMALAPGWFGAALFIPQGVESGLGTLFLVLCGVLNAIIYTLPIFLLHRAFR